MLTWLIATSIALQATDAAAPLADSGRGPQLVTVGHHPAWVGHALVLLPAIAIMLAWLSYRRIRARAERRDEERAALFATIARGMISRQRATARATAETAGQPLSPSDPPS